MVDSLVIAAFPIVKRALNDVPAASEDYPIVGPLPKNMENQPRRAQVPILLGKKTRGFHLCLRMLPQHRKMIE